MSLGIKEYKGFFWPEWDTQASAVICDQVVDVEHALKYVKDFQVAIQAGGNVGVWPKYLSKRFKEVHTFEPEPSNWACLEKNCPELSIIKWPHALGRLSGRVGMEYPEGRENMGACCVKPNIGDISVVRIDDLNLIACGLIQLDIEGYEIEAILGAARTIERFRPVLMVEDKGLSAKYGYAQGWSDTLLTEWGYEVVDKINRDVILVHRG